MSSQREIFRVKIIDGEPMLDKYCMGVLLGVEPDAMLALPVEDGKSKIPRDWIKRGRRRAREAMAHTGSDAMLDCLRYWAPKDHGAELEVTYQ